eukprot:8701215-Alexandrium_andersonii.AAC.1
MCIRDRSRPCGLGAGLAALALSQCASTRAGQRWGRATSARASGARATAGVGGGATCPRGPASASTRPSASL